MRTLRALIRLLHRQGCFRTAKRARGRVKAERSDHREQKLEAGNPNRNRQPAYMENVESCTQRSITVDCEAK